MSLRQTMSSVLWPTRGHRALRQLGLVFAGVILLCIASKIEVPMQPISLTMQSLAVLFVGMAYGWRLGGITVAFYLLMGVMNLPVFSQEEFGLSTFSGPLGGYLMGSLPAAMVSGYLVEKGWGSSNFTAALSAFTGIVIIYLFGLINLTRLLGWDLAVDFGLTPFLFVDLLKILFLTFLIPLIWKSRA